MMQHDGVAGQDNVNNYQFSGEKEQNLPSVRTRTPFRPTIIAATYSLPEAQRTQTVREVV